MRKLVTLLLLLFAVPSFAQITITYDGFLQGFISDGGMARSSSYNATSLDLAPGLINISGTNKSWDFSGATYTADTLAAHSRVFAAPGGAPLSGDADFSTATHVLEQYPTTPGSPIDYIYFRINASGLYFLGMVTDSLGVIKKQLVYQGGLQEMAFPCTYGTHWTSSSDITSDQLPPGATMNFAEDVTVDGYGSLVTPTVAHRKGDILSSTNSCLRLNRKTTMTISVSGFGITTITYTYSWYTLGGSSATITTDQNSAPRSMSYNSLPGGTNGVSLSDEDPYAFRLVENPTSGSTGVSVTSAEAQPARIILSDALGNGSTTLFNGTLQAGMNTIPLNASTLASGTYYIRIQSQGMNATRKLVVVH